MRPDAAVAPSSCFRQVQGRPLAVLSEPAPAVAWRQQPEEAASAQAMASSSEMKAAVVVASSVRPVASAPQARLPEEEAVAASGAKVRPPGVAEVARAPSARQPGAAEEASEPSAQLPVGAEAE